MIKAERDPRRTAALTAGALLLTTVWSVAGCGMTPPPEYHNAAKADALDLTPLEGGEDDGDAGPTGDAAVEPSEGKLPVVVGFATIPAVPIANFLGKSREVIESLFAPVGPEDEQHPDGWVRYTDHLKLLYAEDSVTEFAQQIPSGLSCVAAAEWLGFAEVDPPAESGDRCTWSGQPGAALGDGISGELSVKSGLFHARLVK